MHFEKCTLISDNNVIELTEGEGGYIYKDASIHIESDGKMPGSPYLRIYNDGSQNSSQVMTATKELSLPDGPGLVHAGFKYSTAHGNYAATAGLTDVGNKGISICSSWSGIWISDTVTVD